MGFSNNGAVGSLGDKNSLTGLCLNHIRQLIDRAGVYSKLIDVRGEAYIDANGRNDTVTTTTTTAIFDTNKYKNPTGITESNTAVSSAVVQDTFSVTATVKTSGYFSTIKFYKGSASGTYTITITQGSVSATKTGNIASGVNTINFALSDYTNSTPLTAGNCTIDISGGDLYRLTGQTFNGTTFSFSNQAIPSGSAVMSFATFTGAGDGVIVHTIPTGSMSANLSKIFLAPFIEDWETGCDIKYKIYNATEDSGWLDCADTPDINTTTTFTSEPTGYAVKLVAKSGGTAGYPSIKGCAIKELI